MNLKHRIIYAILRWPVALYILLKFNYRFKMAKGLPDSYIVLSNHVTDFDPIFVGLSFPKQMYFVASEHIARWKNAFKFIRFGFDPIMRYKGSVAASTVMEVLRRVKAGNRVCIFAEGVRTWDGITNPILPATGKMVKSARCALVTYKIIGGYFTSPNWSEGKGTRRGYLRGGVVNVYTAEQLAEMSVDEVNEIINRDLYEDAYARQLESPKRYKGKGLAERMENLLFICPECGEIDSIVSVDNKASCCSCSHSFTYDEYGMLSGSRFKTILELSNWQKEEILKAAQRGETFYASNATLSTVSKHVETHLVSGEASISAEAIRCGSISIPLADITELAMHGRHAIVFSVGKTYYELISKHSNMLKFHLLYNAHKANAEKEAANQ
ncbi:MAG: 1-acyl-sn-glycerol-3-phosphate acyltransferase [Oscillospiraceae bacterium]|nr:1-acyl-sn-glycerol-3-phosphate acyltransferase [Oscillospiraceae bacterium]